MYSFYMSQCLVTSENLEQELLESHRKNAKICTAITACDCEVDARFLKNSYFSLQAEIEYMMWLQKAIR